MKTIFLWKGWTHKGWWGQNNEWQQEWVGVQQKDVRGPWLWIYYCAFCALDGEPGWVTTSPDPFTDLSPVEITPESPHTTHTLSDINKNITRVQKTHKKFIPSSNTERGK